MKSQTAREEAVAVRVVQHHSRLGPRHREAACIHAGKKIDVGIRVTDDRRFPSGSRGCVNATDLVALTAEETERVVVPEILFAGDRESGDVVDARDIARASHRLRRACRGRNRHARRRWRRGPRVAATAAFSARWSSWIRVQVRRSLDHPSGSATTDILTRPASLGVTRTFKADTTRKRGPVSTPAPVLRTVTPRRSRHVGSARTSCWPPCRSPCNPEGRRRARSPWRLRPSRSAPCPSGSPASTDGGTS